MAKLGDLCDILNGFAFKSEQYVPDGIRVIRISNVQKGYIEDATPVFYPFNSTDAQKVMLKENDLLMSLTGNVGRVALLSKKFLPAALNQRVACIRIKDESVIDKTFLFNFLNSDFFENKCIAASKGVAQKNMSTTWLKDYEIPSFSLPLQLKIAAELSTVNRLAALKRQQLSKLDQLVKSQFIEMFGDPETNSMGWEHGTIKDIVSDVRYGSSRKAVENGKYPYLRMNNITYEGELDLSDTKRIDVPDNELPKCSVRRGDVLFNRTNSKELVGKTCLYDREELMVLAGFVIRVRVNEKALPEFLVTYMNLPQTKKLLLSMCRAACGQANINAIEFQGIPIYIPPVELQKQFATLKQQADKSKFAIQQSLEKLETLKKSLMQEYFG